MLATVLYLGGKCSALLSFAWNVTFAKSEKTVDYIPTILLTPSNN